MFRWRLFAMALIVFCMLAVAFALTPTSTPIPTPVKTPSPSPSPTPTPFVRPLNINDIWSDLGDVSTPSPSSPAPPEIYGMVSVEGTALFILLVSLVGVCIAGILLYIKDSQSNQNPL